MSTSPETHPGDKSAAELEREVEAKRAEVEENLDALQDRLSPGQMMDQLFDYAKNGNGAEFTRNLGRSVRDNPIPVALIGAGMAWLMAGGQRAPYNRRRGSDAGSVGRGWDDDWYDEQHDWDGRFEDDVAFGDHLTTGNRADTTSDRSSDQGEGLGSKVGDMVKQAGDMADDAKRQAAAAGERGRDALSDAGERGRDALRDVGERARDQGRRLRRGARGYRDDIGQRAGRYGRRAKRGFLDTLEEQPLVLGAIGIAVGAALGAALPPTEREDELMGETRDQLKEHAEREGRRQVEQARDVADAAYSAAKSEADRQGLNPETGKTEASALKAKTASVVDAAKTAAEKEASTKS